MAENAISFYKGQIAVRGKSQTTCVYHKSETLDLFCETCNDVICAKCVSTSHKDHDTTLLREVTPANKRKIKTFINETEQKKLIEIQQEINSTQDSLDKHLNDSESVAEEVSTQGVTRRALTSYKTELGKTLANLKEQLKQCKKTLQTGTDIQVFDLEKELQTTNTCLDKTYAGSALFVPYNRRNEILGAAFEKVTTPPSGHMKILSEWNYQGNITPICPKSGGSVWINNICKVTHLNSQGTMEQQMHTFGLARDISVSPSTHNLWICCDYDKNITELIHASGVLNHVFSTKDEPRCLCVRKDEHILVGTKHKITEYTLGGEPVITTKTSFFRKPIVCSPQRISQCPINYNVAVVDRDQKGDGGKDKPVVIVLDRQLKQLYRYGESQHNSGTDLWSFDPYDVTYDSLGHLVIADYTNKHLHLLSGDGQYLRLLHTDIDSPRAVCVDTEGVLWAVLEAVYNNGNVKRLQFTNA
ncbi:uncharacterized protein LOC110450688 [Mizuhopecten yessoensis]|uniref:uncharacterized protein LOC110450688 n=1 Tax=Mizuhopecten yessoensis TaxID=6573 RepID=UPI000B459F3F|nr:uncharacterized protein LOC110450688 [Mizuhopecten yessoensis]